MRLLGLIRLGATACRDASGDLYPNSRVVIDRRYSESTWEIAGTHADSMAAIARWYDARFGAYAVIDGDANRAVEHRRWRLPDRSVEVFIVDHGGQRSIYVRESWGSPGAEASSWISPPPRTGSPSATSRRARERRPST